MKDTNFTESDPYIRWKHADWIIPEVINSLLILATLWIIFSLIHFGIKHKKWSTNRMGNADKLSGGSVYTSTVVCAMTALVRFINSQFTFNIGIGVGYDRECEIVSDSSFAWYSLVSFAIYIFLWLRQRIFYSNNMLNVRFGIVLKLVSATSIVILFLAGLAAVLVNTIPVNYPSSRQGCIYKETEDIGPVAWIICVVVVIAAQFVLVGLFVYPLKQDFVQSVCICCPSVVHAANIVKSRACSVATILTTDENAGVNASKNMTTAKCRKCKKKSSKKVKTIMQRTVAFSIIMVATDIILLLITTYTISNEGHRRIPTILYDVNTFLNLIFVICSFLSFRQMLFSPLLNVKALSATTHISSDVACSS
ncbi:uncharacterized protein LOC143451871 [Clavelina lepadiformis]|uniref:uncharacterized protein LOC143451871 n=1 Tax=Clavelina lepadiformis TaxID=159417 RepID=UPI004042AB30